MSNPTEDAFGRGDLVRVGRGPRRGHRAQWPHERLSFLGLFVERAGGFQRSVLVRHIDKLELTFWVFPEELELVQRGEQ